MTTGLIYVIIFGILLVASIILAIILSKILNNDKGIELTGKRLENSEIGRAHV